jgi:predicted O-linked N-acetylglucosamine transferase (SPINDLY family)
MTEQSRPPLVDPRQNPRFLKAFRALEEAVQAQRLGRIEEADRLFARLIKKNRDYFDALNLYGVFNYHQGKYQAAFDLLKRATAIHPRSISALNNLGIVLCHLKRAEEAFQVFERAVALDPADANSLNNRGNALLDLKRPETALASFDAAIELQPTFLNAYINRGRALVELERNEDALANYDKALSLAPLDADVHNNRGTVLYKLHRLEEALASFDRAIALKPNLSDAYCNRGSALRDIKRYKEAIADFERTLALQPNSSNAWCGLGSIFNTTRRYDAAYDAYNKALALNPDQEYAMAPRIHAKMQLCNWTDLDVDFANVLASLRRDIVVGDPFSFLCVPASPQDYLRCAKLFTGGSTAAKETLAGARNKHDRIRIAYISSDFRSHSVGYLMAGVLEAHDCTNFEVSAISLVGATSDEMQTKFRGVFERFLDVEAQNDREIAEKIRDLEIDILIDLNGFTQNSRTLVLAERPAPIQVNYLGYSGTMGADYIDYIIADQTVLPPEHAKFYSEKIAWLPDTYMPGDDKRLVSERTPTRRECGLPDNGVVFCCFNQSFKITPDVFSIWMNVLKAIDQSVLWLSSANAIAEANLRREAEASGVSPQRLIFAPVIPQTADHLARLRQADLFLDTLPYNAHTTAYEALWIGLPVVTLIGDAFHGRVAASLLKAIGLSELITTSSEAYEALAIELARNPTKLAELKQMLERNRSLAPLFDTKRFTRNIEAAYAAMYGRHQAGLEPDHIVVPRFA